MGKGKKKKGGGNDKSLKKQQEKVLVDKTFGLKNKKKSKKVQNFVKQVEQQVKYRGRDVRLVKREEQERKARLDAKKRREAEKKELESLFKKVVPSSSSVTQKKLTPGQDPKSMLCAYFQAGNCRRGKKCKFSHDMSLARKVEKANIYEDPRESDTMDKWDQAKLEEVINKKHFVKSNATTIVCKFFLDAIEKRKYGWFWKCPNGKQCIYRHRLPPGFVFKAKVEEQKQDDDSGPSIEEKIEEERAKLTLSKCTPVTEESFAAWKAKKKKEKEAAIKQQVDEAKKTKKSKGTKGMMALNGRALFTFDPNLFVDDDDAEEEYAIEQWNPDEDEKNDNDKKDSAPNKDANDAGKADVDAAAAAAAAAVNDPSLFLDDDVDDLPSDIDDDEE